MDFHGLANKLTHLKLNLQKFLNKLRSGLAHAFENFQGETACENCVVQAVLDLFEGHWFRPIVFCSQNWK